VPPTPWTVRTGASGRGTVCVETTGAEAHQHTTKRLAGFDRRPPVRDWKAAAERPAWTRPAGSLGVV
jgi:hypothetical protein